MIINRNRLNRLANLSISDEKLYETTNNYITEIERVIKPLDTKLVVGKVLTCINHPDSDHLHITTVQVGKDEVLQIVCGASNVREDIYVIVALVGAVLPGDFEIKPSKIRGVESFGMICSLKELGLKNISKKYEEGIFIFDEKEEIGKPAMKALHMDSCDYELSLTPNRSDLLSYKGFINDFLAVSKKENIFEKNEYYKDFDLKNHLKLEVNAPNCLEFNLGYMELKNKVETRLYVMSELMRNGITPINFAVDYCNYLTLIYGTPCHLYDYDKFGSDTLHVRQDYEGKVITFDGTEVKLQKGDIVITNGKEVKSIAGIIGLENCKVDEDTTKFIIEFANFDSNQINQTAKRLGIKTHASERFSKFVPKEYVKEAKIDFVNYLSEDNNYKIANFIEFNNYKENKTLIRVDLKRLKSYLGTTIKNDTIVEYLKYLNFSFDIQKEKYEDSKDIKYCIPPFYRSDILIEEDIYEEVLRLIGFENIKSKPFTSNLIADLPEEIKVGNYFRNILSNYGFNEVISYSLVDKDNSFFEIGKTMELLMPQSEFRKYMRKNLVESLYKRYLYNKNHKNDLINLFEIGRIYSNKKEQSQLACLLSGKMQSNLWQKNSQKMDFFTLKAILENMLKEYNLELKYVESNYSLLHPYRQADILVEEEKIGVIGQILDLDNKEEVYVFELNLNFFEKHKREVTLEKVSKFPIVTRDVSFLVNENESISKIEFILTQTTKKMLYKLDLVDVYKGENIPVGKISLSYRIHFSDKTRTLESQDVDKVMKSVYNRLKYEFGAEIR